MIPDSVLRQKKIYISGVSRLENAALARFLVQETGVPCEEVSFEHMETLGRGPHPPKSLLFLMDALDPGLRSTSQANNGGTNGTLPAGLFPILFREDPNGNGPDKTAPGCLCGFFYRFDSADRFLQALLDLFTDRELIPSRTTRRLREAEIRPRSGRKSPPEPEGVPHFVSDGRRPPQRGYCRPSQHQRPYRPDSPLQYLP